MTIRPVILISNPADFVRLVQRHGLISPRDDGPLVFRLDECLRENRYHRGADELEDTRFVRYQAPIQLFDILSHARFDASPSLPPGWEASDKKIVCKFESKKDAVAMLRNFDIDAELLKKFDKIKVSQLEELTDSSPSHDQNVEEILLRTTKTPPDVLVFNVTKGPVDKIHVRVFKEKHSTTLKYRMTAEYGAHWDAREQAIEKAVKDAGFAVYAGRLTD